MRISRALRHSLLTCSSEIGSHLVSCSICLAKEAGYERSGNIRWDQIATVSFEKSGKHGNGEDKCVCYWFGAWAHLSRSLGIWSLFQSSTNVNKLRGSTASDKKAMKAAKRVRSCGVGEKKLPLWLQFSTLGRQSSYHPSCVKCNYVNICACQMEDK
jgi:hypothetical protein